MSCYVPAFTEQNGRLQKAACGRWVVTKTEHSTEPTCDQCKTYLEAEAATEDMTAEDRFGPPNPPGSTIKHVDFDPCAGYRPRIR